MGPECFEAWHLCHGGVAGQWRQRAQGVATGDRVGMAHEQGIVS